MGKRSIFFVDGFNLYHSLDGNSNFHKYKWLDLHKLAIQFSHPPYEYLQGIRYFTAIASWKPDSASRHNAYIRALQSVGVQVTFGRFQEKLRRCRAIAGCGKSYTIHEEKLTDVNIAVSIVEACVTNQCDILYLVSGDNDLVPALETAKRLCVGIEITVVLPIDAKAKMLTKICHANSYTVAKISEQYLAASQFPNPVFVNGKTYHKPISWI